MVICHIIFPRTFWAATSRFLLTFLWVKGVCKFPDASKKSPATPASNVVANKQENTSPSIYWKNKSRSESSKTCGWASIAMINCVVDPYESEAECPTWTNILRDLNPYLSENGLLNRFLTGFCSIVAFLLTNWYIKSLTLKKVIVKEKKNRLKKRRNMDNVSR